MKTGLVMLGALVAGAMAQTTASCPEGVTTCDATATASAAVVTPTEDHSHHEGGVDTRSQDPGTEKGTEGGTLPPSPTNSGECHNRGDHWHCMGAEETEKPGAAGRAAGVGMGAALAAVAAMGM